MTIDILLYLLGKVYTEREKECTYDSSLAWKMAIGQEGETFEHKI